MTRVNLLALAVLVVAAWSAYSRHHAGETPTQAPAAIAAPPSNAGEARSLAPESAGADPQPNIPDSRQTPFRCDGRTYCSEMTSCAEAKYFLTHCPDVKMDGDHDGIPCERQWCPNG